MSWKTLNRWVCLACLSFTFFHLYNECGIFAKVAAVIPFPVLIILCNITAFQKLDVSCFTSSSGLALWLNLADRLVEMCADSEPRPKETLHASALCHGILTSQHVKKPRLTCWRMRDHVEREAASITGASHRSVSEVPLDQHAWLLQLWVTQARPDKNHPAEHRPNCWSSKLWAKKMVVC